MGSMAGVWGGNTGGTRDYNISNSYDGGTGGTFSIPDALKEAADCKGISEADQHYYFRQAWLPTAEIIRRFRP